MNTPSSSATMAASSARVAAPKGQGIVLALSWTVVSIPLLWGVAETLRKALALFQ